MGIFETAAIAFGTLLITGLAYVAYLHPVRFRLVAGVLAAIDSAIFIIVIAWKHGVQTGFYNALGLDGNSFSGDTLSYLNGIGPDVNITSFVSIGFLLVLLALINLPNFGITHDSKDGKNPE